MFLAGFLPALIVSPNLACDHKKDPSAATNPSATREAGGTTPGVTGAKQQPAKNPTIASLSPAATDLLVGIGAAAHLVAVSNFDAERDPIASLPRVGDYRTQDWEKLSALRPAKMIVQVDEQRLPAGLRTRAQELGIALVNIKIDDLNDVFEALPKLGRAVAEEQKGQDTLRRLREEFDAVRRRVENEPRVRALIVVDDGGRSVAGQGTFLHDILIAAGGENVAAELQSPWPTVDREKIAQMAPQVVIHLLPGASPQVLAAAHQFWADQPQLPAVRDRRVVFITDWYALLPGYHVGRMAEQFAQILHPATTQPR